MTNLYFARCDVCNLPKGYGLGYNHDKCGLIRAKKKDNKVPPSKKTLSEKSQKYLVSLAKGEYK